MDTVRNTLWCIGAVLEEYGRQIFRSALAFLLGVVFMGHAVSWWMAEDVCPRAGYATWSPGLLWAICMTYEADGSTVRASVFNAARAGEQ